MHVVDIDNKFKGEKHQIGIWRGDTADLRQYQFAFINSDGRPIPVPHGVHIYGVPRPDGGGTADEALSIERACNLETADIWSEVFLAPEGAVYRVTGLGEVVHFAVPIHDVFVLVPLRTFNRTLDVSELLTVVKEEINSFSPSVIVIYDLPIFRITCEDKGS
ncbi:uncharacterized protein EV420DRAFT_1568768, partial [Desarmillaria tabescens]